MADDDKLELGGERCFAWLAAFSYRRRTPRIPVEYDDHFIAFFYAINNFDIDLSVYK